VKFSCLHYLTNISVCENVLRIFGPHGGTDTDDWRKLRDEELVNFKLGQYGQIMYYAYGRCEVQTKFRPQIERDTHLRDPVDGRIILTL
jgi:hypothetical protein